MRDLVGLSQKQVERVLAEYNPEESKKIPVLEYWLEKGGRKFGRDMAPPLSQEEIRALIGQEVSVESLRRDEESGLSAAERRAAREKAEMTAEEQAMVKPDTGLLLASSNGSSSSADNKAKTDRSNANVKLTPSHYPALPSDPSGTSDFHLPPFSSPQLFIPAYLQPNFRFCTLTYLRHPQARHNYCEIPSPFNAKGDIMKRAWEWYRARKIRMKTYSGGLYPGGTDARARKGWLERGPELRRSGVHEDFY